MLERNLKITPINPFTPRQAQIIEILANGASVKEAASILGVSYFTVRNHIVNDSSGSTGSILGRIEQITGNRPVRHNWIVCLLGDVLLFTDRPKK